MAEQDLPGDSAPSAPAPAPPAAELMTAAPRRHRRRVAFAAGGLVVLGGVGLGLGLALGSSPQPASGPGLSADAKLARHVVLTASDAPAGWRTVNSPSVVGRALAAGNLLGATTSNLDRCLGLPDKQALGLFRGSHLTGAASSPIFTGPGAGVGPAMPGVAQLQSEAQVLRSPADVARDLALASDPKFPQCAAEASASAAQATVNALSGSHDDPGPANGTPVGVLAPTGQHAVSVAATFTVQADGEEVPVDIDMIMVFSGRIEVTITGTAEADEFPPAIVLQAATAVEQRVQSGKAPVHA